MRIALVGNPNVGKSTVFNRLTGQSQQVGNWSGKTVEVARGTFSQAGRAIEVLDLPGAYSLSAYSREEEVTRQYLLEEAPEVIILILDASHLERNLYLALEISELTDRVVIGLNMTEQARSLGIQVNAQELSKALGIPVVQINAANGHGLELLMAQAVKMGKADQSPAVVPVPYPDELERKTRLIEENLVGIPPHRCRWAAMKSMERDSISFSGQLNRTATDGDGQVEKLLTTWEEEGWNAERFEFSFVDAKYRFITTIVRNSTVEVRKGRTWTDRVDQWVLAPVWGYLILGAVLAFVFLASFVATAPLGKSVGQVVASLGDYVGRALVWMQLPSMGQSLVRDGMFTGVGAVMGIFPQLTVFFLFFSVLQESGYLARVAFLGDRFMRSLGLPGKAFFPLVSSYGCNVPGVMATRTLDNYQDRLITMLLTPLIPCIPRLGVMGAIISVFFSGGLAIAVIISLLLLDIGLIVFSARFWRRTVRHSTPSAFVMELPLYHRPTLRQVLVPTWQQTFSFLKKVWTYVLLASVVVWGLSSFPVGVPINESWAGQLGSKLELVGGQLGFDWRIMVALLFGFTAKETTLATLGILYGVADASSTSVVIAMSGVLTPLGAYTFLAVYMLYVPCLATVVSIYKESGSWRWTSFGIMYQLTLSFIVGWLIWHGGQIALTYF